MTSQGPAPSQVAGSAGRAARKAVPRRSLGRWDSRHRGHDALETAAAAQPDGELRAQRLAGLARSPWQHYRGAPEVMAADLASRPDTGLTVQLCGDAHPGNFGQWQLPGTGSVFDIVDVDETISGPFEWDLQRFTAGLPVLAEAAGMKPASARAAVRAGFEGYRQWIGTYAGQPMLDTWFERVDIGGLAGLLDVPQAPRL